MDINQAALDFAPTRKKTTIDYDQAALDFAPEVAKEPWEAYGVPRNPAEENALQRGLRGANIKLTEGGMGIKKLFTDLSPEDQAKLDAGQAYMESPQSGIAPKVGSFGTELAEYLGGPVSPGIPGLVARGVYAGGLGALLHPEERTHQAALAAGGQMAGEGIVKGLGHLLLPSLNPAAKEVYESGVKPTFMQALGGGYKSLEDLSESVPLLGPSIRDAHLRAAKSFNVGTLQKIVNDLNKDVDINNTLTHFEGRPTVPQQLVNVDIQPGTEGYTAVKDAISDAYNRLVSHTSAVMTPEFKAGVEGVRDLARNLRPEFRDQVNRIIDNEVLNRFSPDTAIRTGGDTLKNIDSELSKIITNYANKGGDEGQVGQVAKELRRQLQNALEEQNPMARKALQNANSAFMKLKLMEKATTASVGNDLATPEQLLIAQRQKNRPQFAQGKMPLQEWANINKELIGNKMANSRSAERIAGQDLIAAGIAGLPVAATTYGIGKLLWNPAIQDAMIEASLYPGAKRLLASKTLKAIAPGLGALGAASATRK